MKWYHPVYFKLTFEMEVPGDGRERDCSGVHDRIGASSPEFAVTDADGTCDTLPNSFHALGPFHGVERFWQWQVVRPGELFCELSLLWIGP